ncbi:Bromodomain-containing protein [Rhizophagus irregularis]|uniref:Bromodomain-containing protein n=2 Tax=Rhizophagus irregularis TaxID=588596 RepID=A0A2N1MHG4_9GLOM|nr:Bromodomain-containing protein [Rhizophagus irregularis]
MNITENYIGYDEIIKDFDISEISQSNLPKKKQKVIKKCDKKNLTLTELSQPDTSLPKKTETLQPDLQVVKEYEKENLVLAQPDVSLSKKIVKIPVENYSETLQSVLPKKKFQFTDFCYDILHELENKSYANLFYKYIEKDIKKKIIKYPMDLFTINLKLKNNQYTSLEEFEKDIRLIFCNCYTYNDVESEVYSLGKALECNFNKKWNKKLILQDRQTRELKRVRDDDTEDTDRSWKKQIQILEQNKNNLVYKQVVNDALLIASAYENLVIGNIIPFIEILKTFLYMNTISKGKVANYSSSGVFDERIETINSNPNKLKGFVILVIGFRRILWKPIEEVISNYNYNKI